MSGRQGVLPLEEGLTMAAAVSSISSSFWRLWGFREEDFDDEGLL
jgi:hypothetical protein